MGSLSLLQGIFPTQGSNPGLPHCRQILYQLSLQGSPEYREEYTKSRAPITQLQQLLTLCPSSFISPAPHPCPAPANSSYFAGVFFKINFIFRAILDWQKNCEDSTVTVYPRPQFLYFNILLSYGTVVAVNEPMLLFSCPVVPDSFFGLQHSRPPCPTPSPGVCPSSCPLCR